MIQLVIAILGAVALLLILIFFVLSRIKVAGPNEAFIVTGRKGRTTQSVDGIRSTDNSGQKVVMGASVFVLPVVQKIQSLDLSSRRIHVEITGAVSKQGIRANLQGVAIVKVGGTEDAIRAAAQRFLHQQDEIEEFTREVLAGALRSIVGRLTVEEIIRDRAAFASAVAEEAEHSMTNQGLVLDTFQLQDIIAEGSYLQDLGRPDEAMTVARALVARRPDFAAGHETLAHLQWENAPASAQGTDPLEDFRSAAYAQLAHRELQLRYLRMLLATRRAEDALVWLDRLRGVFPGDVLLDWLAADALDMCGQLEEAGATYARLQPALGASSPAFLNSYARNAFRRGRPDLAATCATLALGLAPHDQEAWAHRGTAWRLAGDAREEWLFDYTRLVGEIDVELPHRNSDPTQGLDALARVLDAMHLARRPPVNQSVRMGSQTPGRLFGRRDPVIRDTAAAIEATVLRWLATLPEVPDHPFLARRRGGVRCVGSWSVRLTSSGHHANHIHNEGWLSSAFYVSLPPSVANATEGSTNGWIQFGQPMSELGLALPPRRMIRPQRGRLLLFPSYMWHGTVPFEDTEPRLTVAFDMRPA